MKKLRWPIYKLFTIIKMKISGTGIAMAIIILAVLISHVKMIFSAVITPENVTEIKMAAFVEEPKDDVSEVWLPCPCGDP